MYYCNNSKNTNYYLFNKTNLNFLNFEKNGFYSNKKLISFFK